MKHLKTTLYVARVLFLRTPVLPLVILVTTLASIVLTTIAFVFTKGNHTEFTIGVHIPIMELISVAIYATIFLFTILNLVTY